MKLSDEARLKRNKYMKEYRKRNKEQIKETNRKYWEKKALQNKSNGDVENEK